MSRITSCFEILKKQGRAGLITYIMTADPNYQVSLDLLQALPDAGADIIELGMAFSDPMADGPTIQMSASRALESGASIKRTFSMVDNFRKKNQNTPLILMGYANPIYAYGLEKFVKDAISSGVDGLIIVDLPIEEEKELKDAIGNKPIDIIHLLAPTTKENRIREISNNSKGFLYYVSVTGVTGTKSADLKKLKKEIDMIKNITDIPVAVGFGIKSPEQAGDIGNMAEAVVVGSSIIKIIEQHLDKTEEIVPKVTEQVRLLSKALRS